MPLSNRPVGANQIARAFDAEAERYHQAFETPLVAANMRATTHRLYSRFFNKGDRILDINCGPGSDFDFFQSLGLTITGVDLSVEMLRVAATRAPQAVLHCLNYNDLDRIDEAFHAICSNFGGMNTQSEFTDFSAKCHRRLLPKGWLFLNIMTPFPLPEILEGLLRRRHFLRRLRKGRSRDVQVGGRPLDVYYFWPGAFYRQFFQSDFQLIGIHGLGVFLPPPYLGPVKMKLPRLSLFLEKYLASRFPFKYWGDHAMVIMQAR